MILPEAVTLLLIINAVLAVNGSQKRGQPTIQSTEEELMTGRIFKGEVATKGQFPYHVALEVFTKRQLFRCSGALISEKSVLTAAHCVNKAFMVVMAFGGIYWNTLSEVGLVRMAIGSASIHIHENYTDGTQFDLARINLPKNIQFTDVIQPVSLPNSTFDLYSNEEAVVAGWGLTGDNVHLQRNLRYFEGKIIDNTICEQSFPVIRSTQICLDNTLGRKSVCTGDSGGGLVVERDGNRVLVGIVSASSMYSCEDGFPSVFTRITSYLNWIGDHY